MDKFEYAVWHGDSPMAPFLREWLAPEKFLVRGDGVWVTDQSGRRYLDARSSLWNLSLGYSNETVKEAIRRQLELLPAATLLAYDHPASVTAEYANALVARMPATLRWVRFGHTGSQMTEAAMLLSRFFRRVMGEPDRMEVVAVEGSYHGQGPGATALSGYMDLHDRCGPLVPGIHHVVDQGNLPQNLIDAIEKLGPEHVTAVFIEALTGDVVARPSSEQLRDVCDICLRHGIHIVMDEVTTGFGRVGDYTRSQLLGITPSMIVLGKGMTGGYQPIAALVVNDDIYSSLADPPMGQALPHGSTTDGHPVAMAAGLAVLEVFDRERILTNVRDQGQWLRESLQRVHERTFPSSSVGGAGLMIHFPLTDENEAGWTGERVRKLRIECETHGLLVSGGESCLWVVPPLSIGREDCSAIVDRLSDALGSVQAPG